MKIFFLAFLFVSVASPVYANDMAAWSMNMSLVSLFPLVLILLSSLGGYYQLKKISDDKGGSYTGIGLCTIIVFFTFAEPGTIYIGVLVISIYSLIRALKMLASASFLENPKSSFASLFGLKVSPEVVKEAKNLGLSSRLKLFGILLVLFTALIADMSICFRNYFWYEMRVADSHYRMQLGLFVKYAKVFPLTKSGEGTLFFATEKIPQRQIKEGLYDDFNSINRFLKELFVHLDYQSPKSFKIWVTPFRQIPRFPYNVLFNTREESFYADQSGVIRRTMVIEQNERCPPSGPVYEPAR